VKKGCVTVVEKIVRRSAKHDDTLDDAKRLLRMSTDKDPLEIVRELRDLGKRVDEIPHQVIDDALQETGGRTLSRSPRTRDLPEIEKAINNPQGEPETRKFLKDLLDNLRRQRDLLDDLGIP
jgi:hypothetical protein